ncbi:hypothetical protein [Corallococcus sp. EGB]|uniref:hypothetical protein n=1 Tax=Corallococcus sp. EGB TaxID=1521117 RepID=UPI001CC07F1B|nr:hypothetical protein [Corallococcus sp. EGB]
MDIESFKRIATTFADTKSDIEFHKGHIAIQHGDDLITGKMLMREGRLLIEENEYQQPAERWIVHRLARLPLLADRILSQIPPEQFFVTPSARLLDRLERAPEQNPQSIDNALDVTTEVLSERPAGMCSILYLTSDAGEGKTTLISQLARKQAHAFKTKTADWLLIPVSLGGRSFLRLDDVIVASLVNRLRFPGLFFEGFVELVKMGVLVPALDGFEEMFVESASGEAVSALGNLLQTFSGSGSVLVAARKAYFEYRSFETQGRLFDALGKTQVSFARLDLIRWDKQKFLIYAQERNIPNADRLYDDVSVALGADHPLLTRAVLVRRLLDVASSVEERDELLKQISPSEYFSQFVRTIVKREAEEKWLDRSGEPPRPLLTIPEHEELLSMLAQEMWENQVDILRHDLIETVAEVFCENKNKNLTTTRQIIDRTKQHALLSQPDSSKLAFGFDHEEFKNYYLGRALAQVLSSGSDAQIRSVLRAGTLPALAVETCVGQLAASNDRVGILGKLQTTTNLETRASFVRENFGALAMRLVQNKTGPLTLEGATFPQDSFIKSHINQIDFRNCTFLGSSLRDAKIEDCHFTECEFERLDIDIGLVVKGTTLVSCRIHVIGHTGAETSIFSPVRIQQELERIGFTFPQAPLQQTSSTEVHDDDEEIILITRMLRLFLRATEVNEGVFRAKMGKSGGIFFDEILPACYRTGILQEVTYQGGGQQRRFRLGRRLSEIQDALTKSGGSFKQFLEFMHA